MGYSEAQIKEYMDHVRQAGGSRYTPDQLSQYENHLRQNYLEQSPGVMEKIGEGAKELASGFLHFPNYLKALDIPGGYVRSAVANAASGLLGKDIGRPDEFWEGYKGNVPSFGEYLRRANAPEGVQEYAGPALDLLSDPMIIKKVLTSTVGPVGNLVSRAGQAIYKNGLKTVDSAALKYGKGPVSDILLKNNVSGTAKSISRQAGALADGMEAKNKMLLDLAHEQGAVPDIDRAFLPGEKAVSRMASERSAIHNDVANKVDGILKEIKDRLSPKPAGPVTYPENIPAYPATPAGNIKDVALNKQAVGSRVPKTAFDTQERANYGNQLLKSLRGGLQGEVERSANEAVFGLGDDIAKNNQEWGTLLDAKKAFQSEAKKGLNKNAFTSVDGILIHNPKVAAMKKAADAAKATWLRTGLGKLMYNAGKNPNIGAGAQGLLLPLVRDEDLQE